MPKGICVAGNMVVDILYPVEKWPKRGELVRVGKNISRSIGGGACNVAADLAQLDPELDIPVYSRVGADAEGDFILDCFHRYPNIDTSGIVREGITPFSMVLSDMESGERTFFTCLGANEDFCEADIDFSKLDGDIFYIGYILILGALDQYDEEYGSRMARLLHHVQQRGMRTAIDVVSEAGDRFRRLVPAALKYTDFCVINELEAQQTTDIPLRDADGRLLRENLPAALKRLREMGVRTWAVIHSPEGGFGMGPDGVYTEVESLRLPEGFIVGTVGAGDAFNAGVLYAAHRGRTLREALELAVASSACSLSSESATGGMRTEAEVMALSRKLRGTEEE